MRGFPTFLLFFTLLFFLTPLLCLSAGDFLDPTEHSDGQKLPETISRKGDPCSSADLITGRLAAMGIKGYRTEALKAAAVAAATELTALYAREGNADSYEILTPEEAKRSWGDAWFKTYWPELEEAVKSTWGQVLRLDGNLFSPSVFPLSWGQTLTGVECPYDFTAEGFETEISVSAPKARKIFADYEKSITVKKARNGRVETVTSGNTVLSGEETADRFGLPSPSFSARVEEGRLIFTCKGKGGGEGMSLYGANEWAKRGMDYREILSRFYPGATLS